MAINRIDIEKLHNDVLNNILDLVLFDNKTLEFYFNQNELNSRGWFFCAIDDANFNIDDDKNEVIQLIHLTKEMENFICLPLNFLKESRNLSKRDELYIFDNKLSDWLEILSFQNEFTLWETLIFNPYKDGLYIIKPWSVGYNLLVAGPAEIIQKFYNNFSNNWLINEKYPIYPI